MDSSLRVHISELDNQLFAGLARLNRKLHLYQLVLEPLRKFLLRRLNLGSFFLLLGLDGFRSNTVCALARVCRLFFGFLAAAEAEPAGLRRLWLLTHNDSA